MPRWIVIAVLTAFLGSGGGLVALGIAYGELKSHEKLPAHQGQIRAWEDQRVVNEKQTEGLHKVDKAVGRVETIVELLAAERGIAVPNNDER